MNLLLTNDDGPGATGLKLLAALLRTHFKEGNLITLIPGRPMTGCGMGIKHRGPLLDMERTEVSPGTWIFPEATPVDIIYHAHHHPDLYLPRGSWDLIAAGINHGENVGTDIFHSGTVGAAMQAAAFGSAAFAFSQALPYDLLDSNQVPDKLFTHTDGPVIQFLRQTRPTPGECWSVNLPAGPAKRLAHVPNAHYSRWREPPLSLIPRARDEQSDKTMLEQGNATVTLLQLRTSAPLRY